MSDEKIFGEIEGIFGWIKSKKKESDQYEVQSSKQQLEEFFDFLSLQVTPEEIKALNELAIYKKEENEKKKLDNDKKKADYYNEPLTHEDLLRVFLVDEKSVEKEKKDLSNAFKLLSKDQNEENISLDRLKQMLQLYNNKEYSEETIESVIQELKNNMEDDEDPEEFNYKKYLDNQFKVKK